MAGTLLRVDFPENGRKRPTRCLEKRLDQLHLARISRSHSVAKPVGLDSMKRAYSPGDAIVFTKEKLSLSPGQRARNVTPATHGETYQYEVDKYWRVIEVQLDGKLRVGTRSGKEHILDPNDPHLRHACWWEKWLIARRFPPLKPVPSDAEEKNAKGMK